ncbi:MAG: hypothetical protein H3C54_01010 [Taibaiella sp.]|nr:hypothetical protein [Taibaiella sp.]
MKKLLITLSFLPLTAMAQDVTQTDDIQPKQYNNEIGISTGLAPVVFDGHSFLDIWLTSRLTYLHNFKKTQVGLVVEGGELEWSSGNIYIGAVLNQKIPLGKTYFYIGGSAGYYHSGQIFEEDWFGNTYQERGYAVGLQAGYVLPLGNRFLFTTEVGIRSTQYWFENYNRVDWNAWGVNHVEWIRFIDSDFSISLPATMGIRYRF